MTVLGPDGKPLGVERQLAELPGWCRGVKYEADDDVVTVLVHVPASSHAIEHVLALQCVPEDVEVLIDALQQCVTRSREASKVLDVPSGPVS